VEVDAIIIGMTGLGQVYHPKINKIKNERGFSVLRRFVFLFILSLILFPLRVEASGLSFRLEQSKVRLSINPGESMAGEIKLYSQSREPISIKVYLEDWEYSNSDGSKSFFAPGSTPLSCAEWVKYSPGSLDIPPYGVGKINYVVNVPENAVGGHFAVMFFETAAESGLEGDRERKAIRSGVGISLRLGSLIYIEANNNSIRSGDFSNFSVKTSEKPKYMTISTTFKNTGNTDIASAASYHLMTKDGIVQARGEFNKIFTFPGDSGELFANWKGLLPAGLYDLVMTFNLGKAQEEAKTGKGPVIIKEAQIEIGPQGEVAKVGDLR